MQKVTTGQKVFLAGRMFVFGERAALSFNNWLEFRGVGLNHQRAFDALPLDEVKREGEFRDFSYEEVAEALGEPRPGCPPREPPF